mmetsp:Transcript_39953/g.114175  ORF Transcript_39953/g.114175 Transcript_39953/m.114175 type:complete len:297 (+) Transcript_39953:134-1024(+)
MTRGGKSQADKAGEREEVYHGQFKKTVICRFFLADKCKKGNKCTFAHSADELQDAPDLTKTALCKQWRRGTCALGSDQCVFAHGRRELRASPAFADLASARQRRPTTSPTVGPGPPPGLGLEPEVPLLCLGKQGVRAETYDSIPSTGCSASSVTSGDSSPRIVGDAADAAFTGAAPFLPIGKIAAGVPWGGLETIAGAEPAFVRLLKAPPARPRARTDPAECLFGACTRLLAGPPPLPEPAFVDLPAPASPALGCWPAGLGKAAGPYLHAADAEHALSPALQGAAGRGQAAWPRGE